MTEVMIGVDPHKRSHTATMLDGDERELRRITVRCGHRQLAEFQRERNRIDELRALDPVTNRVAQATTQQ